MNKDIDKKAYLFYLYYFVIFFAVAIVNSFLSMYLANHGVSESAVGIINGIVQALALFVNPFFGRLTDRARIKNHVLYGGLILSIILLFILYYSTSVKMLVIMAISFMTVFFSLTIIYETITVDITSRAGVPYAPIRMSGTIGFSIMAAVCGFFLSDQEELLFPILIAVMSVSTLIAFLLPRSYNRNNTKEKKERPETGTGS